MKKYLFLISLFLISISVFSQTPRSRVLMGQDTSTHKGGLIYLDTLKTFVCSGCTFKHGTYSDTIVITPSGGGGGNNIYNIDSTLSGNRTVTMSGRTIQWSGGNFGIGDRAPTTLLDVYKSAASATIKVATGLNSGYGSFSVENDLGNAVQFQMIGSTAAGLGAAATGDANIQYNGGSTQNLVIQTRSTNPIILAPNATAALTVGTTGHVKLNAYGGNTITGTAAFDIQEDASGNLIETAIPTGGTTLYSADGTLAGNRAVTMATNKLQFVNGFVGISTAAHTPASLLDVFSATASATINLTSQLSSGYASAAHTNDVGNALQFQMIGSAAGALGIAAAGSGNIQCNSCNINLQAVGVHSIFFGVNGSQVGVFDGTKFGVTGNLTVSGTSTLSGNAGVGDRTPTTTLDVYKSAASSSVTVESGLTTGYASQSFNNNVGNAVQIQMIGSTATALGIAASGTGNVQCNSCDLNIQAIGGHSVFFGSNGTKVATIASTPSYLSIIGSTTTVANINLAAGTKKTTMVAGDLDYVTGHLYFHDGSTDYDLLASSSFTSGTCTCTLTNTTNVASSSIQTNTYSQNGNIVHVQLGVTITPTAGSNTTTVLTIALPVSATTTSQQQVGIANIGQSTLGTVAIVSGTTATLTFAAPSTAGLATSMEFQYKTN